MSAKVPGIGSASPLRKGVIDESGDASRDYFSSKKNVVKGSLKGLARGGGR